MAIQDFDYQFEPFGGEPDYRLYYNSKQHGKALIAINEGIAAGEGFVAITGEAGSGKTTLLNFVVSRLEPGRYVAARIDARECEETAVLHLIARGFGMASTDSDDDVLETKLRKFLFDSQRRDRRGLLLIDEAHCLPPAAFEALLDLSRPRDGEGQVLQSVLFGEARLRDLLYGQDLSRYRLNVVASHHLQALDLEETRRLIEHRLRQAGAHGGSVFTGQAVEMIHLQTGGIPSRIVELCREAIDLAAAKGLVRIDGAAVQQVSLKQKRDWVRDEGGDAVGEHTEDLTLTEPLENGASDDEDNRPALPPFLAREALGEDVHAGEGFRFRASLIYGALTIGLSALALFAWQQQGREAPEDGVTIALTETETETEPGIAPATSPESFVEPAPDRTEQPAIDAAATPSPPVAGTPGDLSDEMTAPPVGADSGADVVTVPPPPPARQEPLAAGEPALGEPVETAVETAVETDVQPVIEAASPEVNVEPEPPTASRTQGSATARSTQADPDLSRTESMTASTDLEIPPVPTRTEAGSTQQSLLAEDAPAGEAAPSLPAPIDLAPWKSNSGSQNEPADRAAKPAAASTGPISSLGDKTIGQAAVADSEQAIVETARLAAASTETSEPLESADASDLSVTELVLARQIEDREPVGVGQSFSLEDKQVYAFARVDNPGPRTEIAFRWYLNGEFVGQAPMAVGTSPGWRTWSFAPLEPGAWRVEVADQDGHVLAGREFTVE